MKVKIRFKQNLTEFLTYSLIVGLMMILFFEPFEVTFFTGLGVWVAFIAIVLVTIVAAIEKRIYKNPITVCTVLFAVIAVFSVIISNQMSYKSIVTLMSALEIPLFILSVSLISSEKLIKFIYKSFVIISLFFIALSFTSLAHIFKNEYGVSQQDFLTLGYGNPNKTGMLLFACFAVLLSYLFYEESAIKKLLITADLAYILVLIFQTLSRACTIIAVLLIAFSFVKSRKVINVFSKICCIVPLVFAPLFIIFPSQIMQSKLLGETIDTGRLSIYINVLKNMNVKNFIIGNYTYQFSNLHNVYISVFATVGIIGVILFAVLYFFINQNLCRTYEDKPSKIAFLAISLYSLHSSVEAAMFLSGSLYATIIILLYVLCINKTDKESELRRIG